MSSTKPECPYETASILSKLTFSWGLGILKAGLRGSLTEEGLYKPPSWARAHHQHSKFQRIWNREKRRRWGLMKCLTLCFWKPLAVVWLIAAITEMVKITQPIIVAALVRYMSGSEDISDTMAYLLVAAITGTSLLIAILYENGVHIRYTTSMNMRTTCATAIFNKVTTLSSRTRREITSGHIVTLMGTDIEAFHLGLQCVNSILIAPLALLTIGLLEGFQIGVAVTAGMAVIAFYIAVRSLTGYLQGRLKLAESLWTDRRVHLMGEIITAMRVVKMYCWEKPFAARIKTFRRKETSELKKNVLLQYLSLATSYMMGNITSYVSLCVYAALGNHVTPEIAVKLIGWMKAMEPTVFVTLTTATATFSEMAVALRRIEDFLNTDDMEAPESKTLPTRSEVTEVTFQGVNATWGAKADPSPEKVHPSYTLRNMTFSVAKGQLVAVVGPVGAGKSSVLMAILRELAISEGELHVHGSVAYVPQESWILSDTVRYNILMNNDMDAEKYEAIVKACALDVDLHDFSDGDLTLVGERGLSLSGGQKARINLARAVYQDADIFLLDDPLSAVDSKVGNTIFNECICGMLRSKIRILVTHQLQYLKYVDKVIVMDEGRIVSMGTYESVSSDIELDVYVKTRDHDNPEAKVDSKDTTSEHNVIRGVAMSEEHPSSAIMKKKEQPRSWSEVPVVGRNAVEKDEELLWPDDQLSVSGDGSMKEKLLKSSQPLKMVSHTGYGTIDKKGEDSRKIRQTEAVSNNVYLSYIKAGFGAVLIPIILVLACVKMVLDVGSEWMMSNWGTQHPSPSWTVTFFADLDTFLTTLSLVLWGLAAIFWVESTVMGCMVVTASRRLYSGMFDRVLRAPMAFFEHSPVGQILNRFSRDTGFMDHMIPYTLFFLVEQPCRVLSYAIYSTILFPWLVVAVVPFVVLVGIVGYVSLKSIRELKRIEARLRSPTYSHLSAMLEGIHVIRAHHLQGYFLEESNAHMDRHTSPWFIYVSTQRCMAFTVQMLVVLLTTAYMVAVIVMMGPDERKAGSFGLSFTYFFAMATPIRHTIQCIADIELAMTSVERILQYCHLDQEAPEHTDLTPPSGWPRNGDVTFYDVSLTYADNDLPALGPLSLRVKAGEKVGVVGRTGAGKSSFFTSLLRMVEPTGTIWIDDVDVTKLGLTDLRSKISVIPQDPMLFSGPLRVNMDPFNEYDDNHLWNVLSQVQLSTKLRALEHGLDTEMGEAGSSFSVGQRQLLCMARALLKNNSIIIIDEATANVDYGTDFTIQRTLSTQFSNCTVLTIAHRLATIITYDKVMVLDHGRLVQFGHPHVLLQDAEGPFHQMVHQMVPAQARHLEATAETSYRDSS